MGLLADHRRKWMARHEAQTEVAQESQQAQQAQQATTTEPENFKKVFSVCLEGKTACSSLEVISNVRNTRR